MIDTKQKLIQIGSSEGITLSKKDLASLGAKRGDILHIKVELADKPDKHAILMNEYKEFIKLYGKTLKNLAER